MFRVPLFWVRLPDRATPLPVLLLDPVRLKLPLFSVKFPVASAAKLTLLVVFVVAVPETVLVELFSVAGIASVELSDPICAPAPVVLLPLILSVLPLKETLPR